MSMYEENWFPTTGMLAKNPRQPPPRDGADLPLPPRGRRPDAAEQFFQKQRQQYPYGRGYAEDQPMPSGGPTLEQLRQKTMPHSLDWGNEDIAQKPTYPTPGEYLPLPGEELSLPDIIRRFSVAPGGSF